MKRIFIAGMLVMTLTLISMPVFAASKSGANSASKSSAKTTSKTTAKCDKNYAKCVPIAKDVDCKGGSGDGPKYVKGPIKVLKKDIYRLDHDKDRIACEEK